MTTTQADSSARPTRRNTWTIGHDGSESATTAVEWAMAQRPGRDLHFVLVRCWEVPALDVGLPAGVTVDHAPQHMCTDLDVVVASAEAAGVQVSTRIERGLAAKHLLDASASGDVLVLGARGMGGFGRLLLGSISSQCATHAEVPTIVVPATAATDHPARRIVVGVDGSDRSLRALDWATDFAADDCEIVVVGAWMPSRSGFVAVAQHYTDEREQAGIRFEELLDEREALTDGRRYVRRFAFGDAATILLNEAKDADLVAVGQRGHSGLSGAILGSVTTRVLHHSPVPVAVVPEGR